MLTACADFNGLSNDSSGDPNVHDLIDFSLAVVDLATSAIGIATGAGGSTYVPAHTGYVTPAKGSSQRAAFDSCAALFEQNGDAAGAKKCRDRANSMNSLK
jgi:hypothetical protein